MTARPFAVTLKEGRVDRKIAKREGSPTTSLLSRPKGFSPLCNQPFALCPVIYSSSARSWVAVRIAVRRPLLDCNESPMAHGPWRQPAHRSPASRRGRLFSSSCIVVPYQRKLSQGGRRVGRSEGKRDKVRGGPQFSRRVTSAILLNTSTASPTRPALLRPLCVPYSSPSAGVATSA